MLVMVVAVTTTAASDYRILTAVSAAVPLSQLNGHLSGPPQRHLVVVRGELSPQQHLLKGGPGEVVRKTCPGVDVAEDVHEKAEAADDGAFAARIGVVEEASLIHGLQLQACDDAITVAVHDDKEGLESVPAGQAALLSLHISAAQGPLLVSAAVQECGLAIVDACGGDVLRGGTLHAANVNESSRDVAEVALDVRHCLGKGKTCPHCDVQQLGAMHDADRGQHPCL
mmetsp:Transcript_14004/g.33031  ORF Transcript_14004/g.33031 Transcript_14004/m.33031 type:complete len:227 (+) Transcript_14004:291-971(+)